MITIKNINKNERTLTKYKVLIFTKKKKKTLSKYSHLIIMTIE